MSNTMFLTDVGTHACDAAAAPSAVDPMVRKWTFLYLTVDQKQLYHAKVWGSERSKQPNIMHQLENTPEFCPLKHPSVTSDDACE